MNDQASKIEQLWTEMVGERSPESGCGSGNETLGAQYGACPEKGLLKGVGTDVKNVEGQEDTHKIEGEGCSELREGDKDQIAMTGLF
jgi:hypothetical protein